MIQLTKVRELNLAVPTSPGRPLHLSAASSLVCVGDFLYVIADDEHYLGIFSWKDCAPGQLLRLFPGQLPDDKKARKKLKPDLEVLVFLPAFEGYPTGALLALGSGSRPNRQTGVLLSLNARGEVNDAPRHFDLTGLYDVLRQHFKGLNIEGAVVQNNRLRLMQRGNKKDKQNAVIEFDLSILSEASNLAKKVAVPVPLNGDIMNITLCDLGEVEGVPLGFTDGAALPNGDLIFSAAAENTTDSYLDGACVGSAIGILRSNGELGWLQPLYPKHKVEGIQAHFEEDTLHLLLVTDADDPGIPALLLAAEL